MFYRRYSFELPARGLVPTIVGRAGRGGVTDFFDIVYTGPGTFTFTCNSSQYTGPAKEAGDTPGMKKVESKK